jgi:hypothetical protein
MGTVFIVRQADADVVAASSHAICGIGQIRSRRAMTTESMLDHGTFTPCAWRVLKRVQDACKEECAMERRAEAGQVMARSRASTTDRQAVTSPLSLPYVFFFFFLNLYKATFLCLSVVYMIVDAVYGCVRLCGGR